MPFVYIYVHFVIMSTVCKQQSLTTTCDSITASRAFVKSLWQFLEKITKKKVLTLNTFNLFPCFSILSFIYMAFFPPHGKLHHFLQHGALAIGKLFLHMVSNAHQLFRLIVVHPGIAVLVRALRRVKISPVAVHVPAVELDQVKVHLYLVVTGHLDGVHIHIIAGIALIVHKVPVRPGSLHAARKRQDYKVRCRK